MRYTRCSIHWWFQYDNNLQMLSYLISVWYWIMSNVLFYTNNNIIWCVRTTNIRRCLTINILQYVGKNIMSSENIKTMRSLNAHHSFNYAFKIILHPVLSSVFKHCLKNVVYMFEQMVFLFTWTQCTYNFRWILKTHMIYCAA